MHAPRATAATSSRVPPAAPVQRTLPLSERLDPSAMIGCRLDAEQGSTRSIPGPTLSPMAMGKRRRQAKQPTMWVATNDLPRSAAHPFYTRLNQILAKHDFDQYVEGLCQRFY